MELERWQEADEDFKKVIKLQPRHPKAIAQIAKLNQHISSELHSCPAPACYILAVNPFWCAPFVCRIEFRAKQHGCTATPGSRPCAPKETHAR